MDILFKIWICFLAGAGAGIGTGFAGMSAAAIIGPLLVTFLDIPAYQAVGIGLASDILASAVSARIYKKNNNLRIRESLPMLASVFVFTVIGSIVASFLPEHAIVGTMQIVMILIGLRFILKPEKQTKAQRKQAKGKERLIKSIIGGSLVGFACGFVGAGGGVMLLLVLTVVLGYEMHLAVGTSVFIMAFTALTGSVSHFVIGGMPDIPSLLLCMIFTLLWARIASKLANKASSKTLNIVVGCVMIVTSLIVLTFNYLI